MPHLILNALKFFAAQAARGRAAGQSYLAAPTLTNAASTLTQNPANIQPIINRGIIMNGNRRAHMMQMPISEMAAPVAR